jgi:hypothetical protein
MESKQLIKVEQDGNKIEQNVNIKQEIKNQEENINHIPDIQPNQTIYVNNLNEKIKNEGKKCLKIFFLKKNYK